MIRRAVLLLSLLGLAGCGSAPLDPHRTLALEPGEAHLRTDAESYLLHRDGNGWTTEIGLEFTNPLQETIYVVNCHRILGFTLERWEGGGWQTVWTSVTPLCLSPPITIAAGETFRTTYRIWGAEPGRNTAPAFRDTNLDGTYRLVWHGPVLDYDDRRSGFGEPVPEEVRVSNPFELRKAG